MSAKQLIVPATSPTFNATPNVHLGRKSWGGILFTEVRWTIEIDSEWDVYLNVDGYIVMEQGRDSGTPLAASHKGRMKIGDFTHERQGNRKLTLDPDDALADGIASGRGDNRQGSVTLVQAVADRTVATSVVTRIGNEFGVGGWCQLNLREFKLKVSEA